MDQKCLGCKEECEMSAPYIMTGCVYEDSPYPRDAVIWFKKDFFTDQKDISYYKARLKDIYLTEWAQEEH